MGIAAFEILKLPVDLRVAGKHSLEAF